MYRHKQGQLFLQSDLKCYEQMGPTEQKPAVFAHSLNSFFIASVFSIVIKEWTA